MSQYFYDKQIRRYLIQFARIFSNFNVERGMDNLGNPIVSRIPVVYGDVSRGVAQILTDISANKIPSPPILSYYVTGIDYDRERILEPNFVDKVNIRQRKVNEHGNITSDPGNAFTVERIMPVPYKMQLSIDFWATSNDQKLQFLEQVAPLFNPALEIQSNDSIIDWTSITSVFLEGVSFSSKSIPIGTTNPVDILSMKFSLPIWISSPVKLRKSGVIHKIIMNVFEGDKITDMSDDAILFGTRQKITPYGYTFLLIGNTIQLLPQGQPVTTNNGEFESPVTELLWTAFLNAYGTVNPGISQVRLYNKRTDSEVVGTIQVDPDDDRLLNIQFDLDTLPQDSVLPIDAVVDPTAKAPDHGLAAEATGQRYLIVEPITSSNPAWGGVEVPTNSIIEFDGTTWHSVFDPSGKKNEFVTNLKTMTQYMFDGEEWVKSVDGWYEAGDFSIVI